MHRAAIEAPIEILLVEDNPGDVRLTQEVLREGRIHNILNVVSDGVEALDFLTTEVPTRTAGLRTSSCWTSTCPR